MLPLILPLVISLVPSLTKYLFGDKAAGTIDQVAKVVRQVTGSADLMQAQTALKADPALTTQLTVQLAQIAAQREAEADAARQAELVASLGDVAGARGQTVALAADRSLIAWGSPILSAIVLLTFGAMLGTVLSHAVPAGSEALANVMLGTLAAMATQVANYWLGSSAGSRNKDDVIASAQTALANSTPVKP